MMHQWKIPSGLAALAAIALVAGCGGDTTAKSTTTKSTEKTSTGGKTATKETAKTETASSTVANTDKDDHSGWCCAEHGVPEEECAQCNAKVAAEFKKKGDWCKEHDRPESQCFICHPKKKEQYAAKYRAKYGKEPPPIEEKDAKAGGEKKTEKG